MMLLGHQQSFELAPDAQVPVFENVIEMSTGYQFEKVSVEIFDSLNCDDCTTFVLNTLPNLRQWAQGQENLEIRLFFVPAADQPIQSEAAMALKCASDQNGFWDMHQKIHENKSNLNSKSFIEFATELNLNVEQMQLCQDEQRYLDAIQADINYSSEKLFGSHLVMLVNQHRLLGNQPLENIKKIIQSSLDQINNQPVHSTVITE